MENNQKQVVVAGTKKSMGLSFILTFFFGPLGMLYSTVAGALIMLFVNLVVGFFTMGVGLLLTWPISIAWGMYATKKHNDKIDIQFI